MILNLPENATLTLRARLSYKVPAASILGFVGGLNLWSSNFYPRNVPTHIYIPRAMNLKLSFFGRGVALSFLFLQQILIQ